MKTIIKYFIFFLIPIKAISFPFDNTGFTEFRKIIPSSDFTVECNCSSQEERGTFGITYQEGIVTNELLVLTGVYYDTCKNLERKIKELQKKYKKLILVGTEGDFQEDTQIVWRWRSVKTLNQDECVSYFVHDCEN